MKIGFDPPKSGQLAGMNSYHINCIDRRLGICCSVCAYFLIRVGLNKRELEVGLINNIFWSHRYLMLLFRKKNLRKLTGIKFYKRFGEVLLLKGPFALFSWRQSILKFNYLIHDYLTWLVSITNLLVWYISMI